MTTRPPRTLRWLAAVGLLALSVVLTGGMVFVRHPMATFEVLGRLGLRGAGLHRAELPGPRGRVVYFAGGSGPTVVLLHGANDQAGAWARLARPLAAAHRLLVVDLAGHGESGPRDGELSVGDLLKSVEAVLDAEARGGKVSLVGNSMGGWLSLLLALARPEQVERVVLLNGAALVGETQVNLLPRTREEARASIQALSGRAGRRVPGFVLDDIARRSAGSPLERLLRSPLEPYLLEGKLGDVQQPVTLIWGAADQVMTVAYAEKVAAALPRAKLLTIEGCGHVPQRECPHRLLPLLLQALEGA
jgi:pimeloyl-ACP methyl ester carboxylesterase